MPNLDKEVKDVIINEAQQAADEARQNKAFDDLDSGAPHGDVYKRQGEYIGIVDWESVEVDTPIFVRMRSKDLWARRHFAKYENGKVYAWINGKTSWSNRVCDEPSYWECAKLAGDRT